MNLDISNKESTCKAVASSRAEQPHAVKGLLTNSGVALQGWRSKKESLARFWGEVRMPILLNYC